MTPDHLCVFCKAPRPGTVKTRIAAALGPDRARDIYVELASAVLTQAREIENVALFFSPDDAEREIEPWRRRSEWILRGQGPGDLGERLARAFESTFLRGAERVLVIGTDSPEIRAEDWREGFKALREVDLVLGPAADGGYWMIGLRAPQPALFAGIAWSTPTVLAETLIVARTLGLSSRQLRVLEDVDTPDDWERYLARKAGRSPG
ncbi:MAG: TIGR04282 family arsenosugar biosynthesis glycosyltransferase [Verrucomicrobia bacterium]|nr:TIGR04282 family arsenosugar biosynthesis glycosyltransferase [Verrucomicrobiota bacterium]MBI3870730.1 TIGR04282 family arsenosugar biosynthesis glycosyltransferase [Verrucomicrobiota bacterium]